MDQLTQTHLEAEFSSLLSSIGIAASSDAAMEVHRLLRRADDVPHARVRDAERALEQLVLAAVNVNRLGGYSSDLLAEDLRKALASVCPLWPFC